MNSYDISRLAINDHIHIKQIFCPGVFYPVDDDLAYDYNVKCEALTGYYYLKRRVLADNYSVKWKALSDDYSVKRRALDDKITAIIPDCKWDGRTILHG